MKVAAFMDELVVPGGAYTHFAKFTVGLMKRKHHVRDYYRKGGPYPSSRLSLVRGINEWNPDIVYVFHFRSVWILPFIRAPCAYVLLEPPRAFYEQWLWDQLSAKKKILVYIQGQIDRFIVRRYMQYGIANSAFSAEAGYRAYGKFFDVVYPGVDMREFYPEDE